MKNLFILFSVCLLAISTTAQIDRSKAPEPQPNPEIKINIPQSMTFSNGMQVIMVENHKLPKVSFQLFVDYPTPLEGDKAGLRSIFGEMLEAGTENTPKDEFDRKIDFIGAKLYTNSRGFFASSLKKHTPKLLELLKEVITQPAFTQEDFDRIKAQNLSNLASLPSEASSISANVSDVVNYGLNHPYGEIMTEETLENITLQDVKDFYATYFKPNNAYLVVVGDVTRDDVKQYMAEYFEVWEKGEEVEETKYAVPNVKGEQVYFVNKPGAVQSVISITHPVTLSPGHEDEIKLRVLNQILGGGSFSARLMSNLREDKAYTYGAYSSISSDKLIGEFSAGGSFRNEVTDSAIVQLMHEIERITNETVTDQELDLVKKSMTGAFARSLENPETIARFALNTVRYNLPDNYYANYLKMLERINKNDLLVVASKYLRPNNLNIVVVGNEEIAEKLARFDSDKIAFKNYYGEDVEMLKDAPAGVTVSSIITNYTHKVMMVNNAEEFEAKAEKVNQIEIISKADVKEMGAMLYTYNISGAPNKSASFLFVKSAMGAQTPQKSWFNGTSGKKVEMAKITEYEGDELARLKKQTTFPVAQMAYLNSPYITTELMGIDTYKDQDVYKIKISQDDEVSFEYYNVETGLLMKKEVLVEDQNGEQQMAVSIFDNYTEMEGLYMPKSMTLNAQGQSFKFEVVSFEVSKKAKSKAYEGDFKKAMKKIGKL